MNTDIAYAAGLLDGEGSIMLLGQGPDRPRRPVVTVAVTTPELTTFLSDTFGGSVQHKPKKESLSEIHAWSLRGNKAVGFLRDALPYLTIERRRALAGLVSEWCPQRPGRVALPQARRRTARYNELALEMRARNQRRGLGVPDVPPTAASEEDYAYLAGIIDGEGWVSPGSPRVFVYSTDPELPGWLRSRFDGVAGLHTQAVGNQRPVFLWRSRKAETLIFAPRILRYLRLPEKRKNILGWEDFEPGRDDA